ncbi:glycoprotein-N-acetylgalactosamine 3-beta-galactosyltransferase 1-like [Euwallacea similis]|uniref:glycoprotein-N-acetylgalactosamine 3-beta-galactosyltransferase 1-like n=1 Tax=Euwallacea similis TaxID=1736056 RepID=UPI00344D1606
MRKLKSFSRNRIFRTIPNAEYFLAGLGIGSIIGILLITQIGSISLPRRFLIFNLEKNVQEFSDVGDHNESNHDSFINGSIAQQLYDEVKILCWILTGPKNHESKAKHVKATWGKRCNYLLFMSTKEDPSLPSVALPNLIENRDNLWGKTKAAFKYVYDNYYDKVDWFYKADDDTYTIVENMRYMLHYHTKTEPIYFGFRFKPIVKQGYMSGGAGYVLSKEALRRFIQESLPDPHKCKKDNTGAEDVEMGRCLEAVGITAGDSRDRQGRSSFLPLYIDSFLIPGSLKKDFWFWSYIYYPFKEGLECCSDNLISIHYVKPSNMYLLEYLIYHVKPFGLSYNPNFNTVVFGNPNNTVDFIKLEKSRPDSYRNTSIIQVKRKL